MLTRTKLDSCGLPNLEPGQLRDAVLDLAAEMFPGVNRDRILCNPTKMAIPLVKAVRQRLGVGRELSEEVVLMDLVNAAKRP